MKVVFDTNIFVSALTLPGGRGAQVLGRIIAGEDSLAISRPIVDELLVVLARTFAREREELARVAVFLGSLAEVVEPSEALRDSRPGVQESVQRPNRLTLADLSRAGSR